MPTPPKRLRFDRLAVETRRRIRAALVASGLHDPDRLARGMRLPSFLPDVVVDDAEVIAEVDQIRREVPGLWTGAIREAPTP